MTREPKWSKKGRRKTTGTKLHRGAPWRPIGFVGDLSSQGTEKAKQAYEVCKGSYKRSRGVYKGKGEPGKTTREFMVDQSSWLGSRLPQDEGEDGLQEGKTFRAKALRRIKCRSANSCWDKTLHCSPTHAHGQAQPEVEEKQQLHSGPLSARGERTARVQQ